MDREHRLAVKALQMARSRGRAGATLVETMISTVIAMVGLAGLCVANANCLALARAHKEMLVADICLQQRTEQFHAANWYQITDADSASALFSQQAADDSALPDHRETITITPYPPVNPVPTPIVLSRDTTGVVSILSRTPVDFSLRSAAAVRVDVQETWTSVQSKQPRQRGASAIIAFGGLFH